MVYRPSRKSVGTHQNEKKDIFCFFQYRWWDVYPGCLKNKAKKATPKNPNQPISQPNNKEHQTNQQSTKTPKTENPSTKQKTQAHKLKPKQPKNPLDSMNGTSCQESWMVDPFLTSLERAFISLWGLVTIIRVETHSRRTNWIYTRTEILMPGTRH